MAGTVWDDVLDTEHAIVVRTDIERWPRKGRAPEKVLVIVVGPDEETRHRCPQCGTCGKPVGHDVVRWRTLGVHGKRAFLESRVPRIICGEHGKVTAAVPWSRHDDRFRFTRPMNNQPIPESRGGPLNRCRVGIVSEGGGRTCASRRRPHPSAPH